MNQPSFDSLPDAGNGYRYVNGSPMTEAEFREDGWLVVGEYPGDNGQTIQYWAVSRPGTYGRKRRSAWQNRRDAEDEYSESIQQLIEERSKP